MKSYVVDPYKKQPQRNYNKRLGVIFNGTDNLRPTIIENLFDVSPTATQAAWIYQSFLGGGGFEQDIQVNLSKNYWEKYTPEDLLFDLCEPVSRHQGCFIHVQYNALFEKEHFSIVPYSLCRLSQPDSDNHKAQVYVSEFGWGRDYKKANTKIYDIYNPRPEVILQQVERDGGWDKYKGQILFFKLENKHDYPNSLLESAYALADVEHHLGMYYNSTVKRSFEDITIIRHRKFPEKQAQTDFHENIKKLSGVENASSKLVVEDDWDDEKNKEGQFKFNTIENKVKSDKYKHFEESAANYIRKAFKNIPPQLIDHVTGKLGNTTGEDIIRAQALYSRLISRDRLKLERLFAELFRGFKQETTDDWTIKPFLLIEDEENNDNGQD